MKNFKFSRSLNAPITLQRRLQVGTAYWPKVRFGFLINLSPIPGPIIS